MPVEPLTQLVVVPSWEAPKIRRRTMNYSALGAQRKMNTRII